MGTETSGVFVRLVDMMKPRTKEAGVYMETECQPKIQVGQTVSYWDLANPYREGVIVEIKKTEGKSFLLFGGETSMEEITGEATVIYPDSWFKSYVPLNSLRENEYAGHQLHSDVPVKTQEEVDALVAEYERMQPILQAEREKTEKEKEEERNKQKEQLKKDHPDLVQVDHEKYNSRTVGAKNLKYELTEKYPGVKFSVTSESFSGGDAIDVRWYGGPSREDVDKIAKKYQEGHFDGMIDLYEYHYDVWNDVFGGAKYVLCQQEDR